METDEVYNAASRLQKLQCCSVRQLKATPEPRLSHPVPCTPPSPFVTCPASPALAAPPLPPYTQADLSSTAENWIVALFYLAPFFLVARDDHMGLSLSHFYCCLL